MRPTPNEQPSNVSTADTPERPQNVFTEEPAVAEAREASKAAPGEPGQTSDDSAKSPDKSKRKSPRDRPAERRISKLTRKLDASQTENAELRERIEALEADKPAPKKTPEPQLRDFKTPQEYAHALNKWETEQKPAPKPKAKPAKPTASKAHAENLKRFAKDGTERIGDTFQAAFKDNDLAINQVMGEFMLDSDIGPEIMVHLHENQDLARQIWFDKPEEATKRLEAIEAELDGDKPATQTDDAAGDDSPARNADGTFAKAEPDPEPKTRTTKSNAPPAPGDSERGELVPGTDLEKAGMDDYSATRRKQYKERGERI